MEHLAIERLRSPRSPRRYSGSFYYPESGANSGASTPFISAPSSPGWRAGFSHHRDSSASGPCRYYSLPPSPPRLSSEESRESQVGVPFSWEESPGTPKESAQNGMKNSVDHLSAMGFHFSAPVSPQRKEFDFLDGLNFNQTMESQNKLGEDEFEFSSARMSDAESVASLAMSHADELFFQGQILPLKLPPRLQQKSSIKSLNLQVQDFVASDDFSPTPKVRLRAAGSSFVHRVQSPTSSNSYRARAQLTTPSDKDSYKPHPISSPTNSVRKSLKELLHLNTSSNSGGASNSSSNSTSRSNSSGTESSSHKSPRSSSGSSSSRRFPHSGNSRSSSVSSNRSLGSARSSFSGTSRKQVSPAPPQ